MKGDPLLLGQRLVAVLEQGRRVQTYKFATMVALLDEAVESVPTDRDAAVSIDLDRLAHRVMNLYWHQLRPLDGKVLPQSSQPSAVLKSIRSLKDDHGRGPRGRALPLESVRDSAPDAYASALRQVKELMVENPLKRLQNLSAGESVRFLYDDSWMGTKSKTRIKEHGNCLELYPGVCYQLALLAPLVKPAFQLAWVETVRKLNIEDLGGEFPDLEQHMFGGSRISLEKPTEILVDKFGRDCFYCNDNAGKNLHIDHVLPWSRVMIDGLANLVQSCAKCNSNKSDHLPGPRLVQRAIDRPDLADLAREIAWPYQRDRVDRAAHGLYLTLPAGASLWYGRQKLAPSFDIIWPPPD